jgi:hypothetical protein
VRDIKKLLKDAKEAVQDFRNGKTANFSSKQSIAWIDSLIELVEQQEEDLKVSEDRDKMYAISIQDRINLQKQLAEKDIIIVSSQKESKRLRVALKWYGYKPRYSSASTDPDSPYQRTPEVYGDGGKIARDALSYK